MGRMEVEVVLPAGNARVLAAPPPARLSLLPFPPTEGSMGKLRDLWRISQDESETLFDQSCAHPTERQPAWEFVEAYRAHEVRRRRAVWRLGRGTGRTALLVEWLTRDVAFEPKWELQSPGGGYGTSFIFVPWSAVLETSRRLRNNLDSAWEQAVRGYSRLKDALVHLRGLSLSWYVEASRTLGRVDDASALLFARGLEAQLSMLRAVVQTSHEPDVEEGPSAAVRAGIGKAKLRVAA